MITPSHAALIWSDDHWIYLKLPKVNGYTVHHVRFPNNPIGLQTALTSIRARADAPAPTTDELIEVFKAKNGLVQRTKKKLDPVLVAQATKILRERGMIK